MFRRVKQVITENIQDIKQVPWKEKKWQVLKLSVLLVAALGVLTYSMWIFYQPKVPKKF